MNSKKVDWLKVMSTKIYNAYKFNGKIEDLMEHFFKFRPLWFDMKVNQITQYITTSPAFALQDMKAGVLDFRVIEDAIKLQTSKAFNTHYDLFDIKASVAVLFHKKSIYVIGYLGEFVKHHRDFIDDRFEDFHYQDQSDAWFQFDNKLTPDEKKAAQRNWRKRKKVWDDIFPGCNSASERGLVYNFNQWSDPYEMTTQILKKLVTNENLHQYIASNWVNAYKEGRF